jgi:hypothetical protein
MEEIGEDDEYEGRIADEKALPPVEEEEEEEEVGTEGLQISPLVSIVT